MYVVLGLCFLGLAACFIGLFKTPYLYKRCSKVGDFKLKLVDMACDYNIRRAKEGEFDYRSAYDWFLEKWTFEQMLHSSKPLKLEAWYTKEELEEINR